MTIITARAWNLSNILSLFRIAAIPLVVVFLLSPGRASSFIATFIFLLAAISDALDGYIARKRNTVTSLGKLLDPLADKLLVCTALIMLISLNRVGAWMVAVIIGRELAITTLRGVAAAQGSIISASRLGKLKNLSQVAATGFLILHYPFWSVNMHVLGTVLLWIALIFTLWSGVDYFVRFLKRT